MYVRIRSLPFFVSLLLLAVSSSPVHAQQTTANEDFEFGLPAGWTVIDNTGSGAVWHFDGLGSGNDTGGDGRFAQAESSGVYDDVDTELRTPVMDLSCATRVFLDFKTDANLSLNDVADVDVSVGGGAGPWTNVWRKTASYAGPRTELVDLTSLAAGEDQVMIRFRYYDGFNDGTWQVDDVVVHTNVELLERFPGTLAPASWMVIDNTDSGAVWHFDELGSGNDTGGDGRFAQAESGGVYDDVDTELRTPVIDLSQAMRLILEFKADANLSLNDVADVDVSVAGGAGPWTNVWRKTVSYAGPRTELVDLTSLAAGEDQVMIRFRYYDGFNDGTWQVDDVVVHTNVELLERFPGTLAPAGWTVIDNTDSGAVWHFDELGSGNDTGGDGRFAQAESGDVYDDVDTELRTPVIDLSDATKLRLEFRTDVDLGFNDVADVDVSTAGATGPWTNVWRRSNPYHGPRTEVVDLTSPAAGEADVVLRFRYYDGFNDGTWQVDDVVVSATCVPEPGQLIQLAAGLALLFAFRHSALRRSSSCPARDFTISPR